MDDVTRRFKSFIDFGKHYNLASKFLDSPIQSSKVEKWYKELKLNTKNTKLSNDFRLQANECYKKKDFKTAYDKAQQCLRYAKLDDADDPLNTAAGGCSMSVAYKNRAIYHLYDKKYDECILDIDMAIECGYPNSLLYNLYQTKSRAYIHKRDHVKALDCSDKALKLFEKYGNLDHASKVEFIASMRRKMEEMRENATDRPIKVFTNTCGEICGCQSNKLSQIKCSDDCWLECYCADPPDCQNVYCALYDYIEIRYIEGKGRGIFLTQDIEAGEPIFMDASIASISSRTINDKKCHNCLEWLPSSSIACKYCTQAFYCTKKCSVDGWVTFHRFECGLLEHLHDLKNIAAITYRVFVQQSCSEVKDVLKVLGKALKSHLVGNINNNEHNLPMEGFKYGKYQLKNYYALFHLDTGTRSHDLEANMAALTLCLKLLRLFEAKCESLEVCNSWDLELVQLCGKSDVSVIKTDRRSLQLALLLHHYKQATNHNVNRVQNNIRDNKIPDFDDHMFGQSPARLFPVGALLNHSHDATIDETYDDYYMYSFYRPKRDMTAGEELTIDYDRGDDLNYGSTLNFVCVCNLCIKEPGLTEDDLHYPTLVKFCEKCCEAIPSEKRGKTMHCDSCAADLGTQEDDRFYQIYTLGLKSLKANDLSEAEARFSALNDLHLVADDVPNFSSFVFMSWMALTAYYGRNGKWGKAIFYGCKILEMFDKFPRLKAYQFTGEAAKFLAKGLQHEIAKFRTTGKKKKLKAYSAVLTQVLRREPSGELLPLVSDGLPRGVVKT